MQMITNMVNMISLWIHPVAEFSVTVCSTPKFILTSDDGIPGLLITDNDVS